VRVTYERLKKFADDRDSSKVHAFLSSYGWPEDTNFEEIVPDVLSLYLDHEQWGSVKKMLISLSAQSERWQKEEDPSYCPVKNYHLLQILRRLSNEGEEISLQKMTSYAFELRRLFPGGECERALLEHCTKSGGSFKEFAQHRSTAATVRVLWK
ncbi:hypothetical protein COOONC_17252, partial [Cooperia oncophora]